MSRLTDGAKASRFELGVKGGVAAGLRRVLEAEAERRGIIKAYESTGRDMAEKDLEGETRRREEAEARIGVATEALERTADKAE